LAPFFLDWIPEGSFEKKTAWKLFIASLQGLANCRSESDPSISRKKKRKKKKSIAK
jgi:hypothetical protein